MAKIVEDKNVRRVELDQPIQVDHINDLVPQITSFLVDIIGNTDYSSFAGNDVRDHVVSRIRDLTVTPTDQNWHPITNTPEKKLPEEKATTKSSTTDLPDHIVFYVTEEDIMYGKRQNATSCPFALALKRDFNNNRVVVGSSQLTIGNKSYKIPLELSRDIIKFDDTGQMTPGWYHL